MDRTLTQAHQAFDPTSDLVEQVHAQVTEQFTTLFPKTRHPRGTQENQEVHTLIRQKWYHHQQVRQSQHHRHHTPLHTLFQAWYHWSCFRRLEKLQRHEAKQARLRRFQDLCSDVQDAANRHDPHSMFTIINRYTPKESLPEFASELHPATLLTNMPHMIFWFNMCARPGKALTSSRM